MGLSRTSTPTAAHGVSDKRAALLDAALGLFARDGLQNVPTAAIAREAGVGKGTLFLYFETKEQLLNELYLDVAGRYVEAVGSAADPALEGEAALERFWFAYARWYLENRHAATFLLQCEVSSVLTEETQLRKHRIEMGMARKFFPHDLDRVTGTPIQHVGYALIAGPIQVLAQLRDKGEIDISDDLLAATFTCVSRALTPLAVP